MSALFFLSLSAALSEKQQPLLAQTVPPLVLTGYLESNFNCFRLIPGNYKRLTMTMAAIPTGVTRAGVASVSG